MRELVRLAEEREGAAKAAMAALLESRSSVLQEANNADAPPGELLAGVTDTWWGICSPRCAEGYSAGSVLWVSECQLATCFPHAGP